MDLAKTIFLLFSVMFFAFWIGTIMKSQGADKLAAACEPIEVATDQLIRVSTGLSGFTPNWTLRTKDVLQGGCYYFFSTFLFTKPDEAQHKGGVRTQ